MKKSRLISLMSVIVIGIMMSGTLSVSGVKPVAAVPTVLIRGVPGSTIYWDPDPQIAWDSASGDVLDQVAEGLFMYNLADPALTIVPRLATSCGTWSEDYLEFTVDIRTDVTFHDNTSLTADDVVWTFNRLHNLVELEESWCGELYLPLSVAPGGELDYVIKMVEALDSDTVKFTLNYTFGSFIPLLCFSGSYILKEGSAPFDRMIDPDLGETVMGTGPYKWPTGDPTSLLTFEYYPEYYRGTPAVQEHVWVLYPNTAATCTALLAGDIHIGAALPEFYSQFDADPDITLTGTKNNWATNYIGMSNLHIDVKAREAMSYAFNYEYVINSILLGYAIRLNSPIPPGFSFYNADNPVATFDVAKARQILIDEGLAGDLTMDSVDLDWAIKADTDPIFHFNYTYNTESSIRQQIGQVAKDNMRYIGIDIDVVGVTWGTFLGKLYSTPEELELYNVGWIPDYNDGSNYINPLFHNTSSSNGAQVNDPWLETAMDAALREGNATIRAVAYDEIQEYITMTLFPWIFISVGNGKAAYNNKISYTPRNHMGKVYIFLYVWEDVSPTITDSGLDFNCGGGSAPVEPPVDDDDGGDGGDGLIPGYTLVALLGVAAVTVSLLMKKYRK
jgi:ABC-type transport system substrate-binding protein